MYSMKKERLCAIKRYKYIYIKNEIKLIDVENKIPEMRNALDEIKYC